MTAAERFRALHVPGEPLVMPKAWDEGSAKLLASLGFEAIATTSGGFAATLGRLDGGVTRDEALAHAARLVRAVDVPVSADLENCYADSPEGVAATVSDAVDAGLAGCSVEDWGGAAIYDAELARARVAAAVEAARGRLVVTARAENLIRGRTDIADTVARLESYGSAGADVLFAPGVTDAADIASTVAIGPPVNVLLRRGGPDIPALGKLGVARVSVGAALTWVAMAALAGAAQELRGAGPYAYLDRAAAGRAAAEAAFRR